ncbi:PEGA domain-containing protein [Gracilimonas sediminicola]|uniref:PEGA domain-containing protein n=1 Tax=Gracilimonas sediminicola TaxID=2952158 RepID=A0A9X2RHA8_9BACT|nr:PEGA domain-containing protein [Gracilimonas sediminicola]
MHTQRSKLLFVPIILSLLFGAASLNNLYAQDDNEEMSSLRIVGEAKRLPSEIIADRDDNRDINGNLTAGLRIISDLTGLTFRSNNGIHKVQQLPGYNLLYLSTNERVVSIYKDGYPPFQLVLNDEGISLEAGEVWEIQVTGDQKSTMEPVQFSITPENSTIFIDGEEFEVPGTVFDTELTTGDHFVQIRKDRHEFIDDSISVSADRVNTFRYTMDEINPVTVLINSTPEGASIYLNDEPGARGVTPLRVNIYPGNLKIRLTYPGYSNVEDELEFTGENRELNYNLQRYIGYLTVNTTPENATLLIDDQPQSQRENIELVPGAHILEVRSSGFDPVRRTVDVAQGDSLVENITLGQITGNLFVIAQQENTEFTLRKDGQVQEEWVGSKTFRNIPVGNYQLTAELLNFDTQTREFEIRRNSDEEISIDLNQIQGRGTLTINSVFPDAEIELKGPGFSRTYDEAPIQLPSLQFGRYQITIEKDGFDDVEKEVQVNSLSQEVTFVDEFQPRSKGKAVFRSILPGAVIPGVGHGYLGKGRGFLYFLAGGGALAYSIKSYVDYNNAYNKYQTALDLYNSAGSTADFAKLRSDYRGHYATANDALDQMKLGITAYVAVKGIEIVDLLLQKSNKKKLEEAKLQFSARNNGISMRVNF